MATLAELQDALKNADAAGDAAAATALADEIYGMSQQQTARAEQPAKPPATALDRVQATASGVNSGLANTLGLPVDTAINAADVAKAIGGLGYLGADKINRAFGGEGVVAPAFIKATDRRKVLGSSDNLKAGLNSVGVDTAPARSDDKASRYLNTAANIGSGIYFGGIYGKLGIPTGTPVPPGSGPRPPLGGNPPPSGGAPPLGGPPGGVPPAGGPAPIPPGAPGGPVITAPSGLSATELGTLAAGERLGMKVTPGVRAGSPQLRQLEARLESQPATSGPFNAIKAGNGRVVQREFLKAIGESGDEVSASSLANASKRIGDVFETAAANTKVAYDNDLQTALAQAGARAASELTEADAPIVARQLNEILNKAAATGEIDGPAFQNIYSQLGRIQKSGTGAVKDVIGDVREALHDALIRSAGPKVAGQLKEARTQYRVLRTAEKSGAIDVGSGTIRAGQLGSAFRRTDNAGYNRGYNDTGLYDALRFANTRSFGPIVGDSGTATRLGEFPDSLYRAVANAGGNLATRTYLNTPPSVLAGGVKASNAAGRLIGNLANAPKKNATGVAVGIQSAEDQLSTDPRRALAQALIQAEARKRQERR